jgi:hypothetical protein
VVAAVAEEQHPQDRRRCLLSRQTMDGEDQARGDEVCGRHRAAG